MNHRCPKLSEMYSDTVLVHVKGMSGLLFTRPFFRLSDIKKALTRDMKSAAFNAASVCTHWPMMREYINQSHWIVRLQNHTRCRDIDVDP